MKFPVPLPVRRLVLASVSPELRGGSAMAVEMQRPTEPRAAETVLVDRFCDGIIGPSSELLGPVRDGGHIIANTAPGCWGPMITPAIKGGHEVTLPVAVEGAEIGDAIAIRIRDVSVT